MAEKVSCAQRIREALDIRGFQQKDLCEMTGIPKSAMSQYCKGSFVPKQERTALIAKALNVNEAWLMGYDVPMERTPPAAIPPAANASEIPPGFEPLPPMSTLPIVGSIACGTPILAEQNIEGYTTVPERWKANFILVCHGNSMEPKIRDGDVVAIRKQDEVENGQIAAVRIGEEATLKRVYVYPDYIRLQPENPDVEPIILFKEDMNTAVIEGKAVGICRDL